LLGVPTDALALTPTTTTVQIGDMNGNTLSYAVVGQVIDLLADPEDAAISHPTGTVTFTQGTATLCSGATLGSNGWYQCWWTPSTPSTSPIVAHYSGNATYAASSGTLNAVVKANTVWTTTTALTVNPSDPWQTNYAGMTVDYSASVSSSLGPVPNGTVTFNEGTATIPGCAAVPVSGGEADCQPYYGTAGSHTVTATYNGGQDSPQLVGVRVYPPSSSTAVTATVVRDPTTTFIDTYTNGVGSTVIPGETVTFTAWVYPSWPYTAVDGTVAFTIGGSTIPGCGAVAVTGSGPVSADCATSFSTVSSPQVVASYSGNAFQLPSTSAPYTEQVIISPTTTTLTSSANPTLINTTVAYTANVSSSVGPTPGGTVTFSNGSATIAGCAAVPLTGGVATCSTTHPVAGTAQITATYNGGQYFAASTSSALSEQIVASASTTSTALTAAPNPAVVGQKVTYTAKVTSSSGTVSAGTVAFTNGTATIAGCGSVAVSVGTARCTTSFAQTGTPQITATYTGGGSFAGSASPAVTEQVAPAPTTISCQPSSFSEAFSLGALVIASSSVPGTNAPNTWPPVNAINGFIYSMSVGGQGIAPDIYGCDYPSAAPGGGVLAGYPFVPVNMVITGYSWSGGYTDPMTFTGIVTPATEALLMANATKPLSLQFALEGSGGVDLASGRIAGSFYQIPSQASPAITSTTLQNPTLVKKTTTSGGQAADVVQFTAPAPGVVKPNPLDQVTYAPCPTGAVSGACGSIWFFTWGRFVAPPVGGLLPKHHHHKKHKKHKKHHKTKHHTTKHSTKHHTTKHHTTKHHKTKRHHTTVAARPRSGSTGAAPQL
jgi:hypothetical protein